MELLLTLNKHHVVMTQKEKHFIITTVRTSNPITIYSSPHTFFIPVCHTLIDLIIVTIHVRSKICEVTPCASFLISPLVHVCLFTMMKESRKNYLPILNMLLKVYNLLYLDGVLSLSRSVVLTNLLISYCPISVTILNPENIHKAYKAVRPT
jgi:hypothetical protein